MKNLITIALFLISFNIQAGYKNKYESKEVIQQSYSFKQASDKNTLYIHNIDGFIQVEGYDGDKIVLDIKRTTTAWTKTDLQLGLHETMFKVVNHKDQIHMFIETPYAKLVQKGDTFKFTEKNNNSSKYNYILNYTIKVPKHINLNLTTYNQGYIKINDIQANTITAYNINGEVHLDQVAGVMDIKTINGDISLSYFDNKIKNSTFESINGSFDIKFVEKPNIEVLYETMNGAFYSNIELTSVSTMVKKTVKRKTSGIKYNLKPRKKIIIGNSNRTKFTFTTLNGDINLTQEA